jgi:Domain of unknown function (DUF4326)
MARLVCACKSASEKWSGAKSGHGRDAASCPVRPDRQGQGGNRGGSEIGEELKGRTPVPKRIQRIWAKGWRKPADAIYAGRGTLWDTPFIVGQPSGCDFLDGGDPTPMIASITTEKSLEFYRDLMGGFLSPEMHPHGHRFIERFQRKIKNASPAEWARTVLRGRELMCGCALCEPCHVDVLLEVANGPR